MFSRFNCLYKIFDLLQVLLLSNLAITITNRKLSSKKQRSVTDN